MQDNILFENDIPTCAKIKVVGVGGGGTNAVDSMMDHGLRGVEFYVINTDAQALARSKVPTKIQIGRELTLGRGAGADPSIGSKAAVDAKDEITKAMQGADMVFITAGLGGGTGTGAAPVVAEIAKSMGILTVAVVSRPFRFEGPQRMRKANEGLDRLREFVDTCIIVSNDRLLEVVGPKATLQEAFNVSNNVLSMGVSSISDLISVPGLINVDFADVRTIMNETGGAVMGVGVGKGESRAVEAVKKACSSPLLDKIVIDGARGVLICVTGGADMTLHEINEATTMVYEAAAPDANIIFGAVIDERLKDEVRVTIIATGFDEKSMPTRPGYDDDNHRGPGGGGGGLRERTAMYSGGGGAPGVPSASAAASGATAPVAARTAAPTVGSASSSAMPRPAAPPPPPVPSAAALAGRSALPVPVSASASSTGRNNLTAAATAPAATTGPAPVAGSAPAAGNRPPTAVPGITVASSSAMPRVAASTATPAAGSRSLTPAQGVPSLSVAKPPTGSASSTSNPAIPHTPTPPSSELRSAIRTATPARGIPTAAPAVPPAGTGSSSRNGVVSSATTPADDPRRPAEVFDFASPDNPLRSAAPEEDDVDTLDGRRVPGTKDPTAPRMPTVPSNFEDDLETPAFLRRRKSVFE